MKLLLTGAGGRVGRRLLDRLAGTGHEVRAVARSMKPHLGKADELVLDTLSPETDFAALLDGVDTLIHLADGFNAYEQLPVDHHDEEAETRLRTLELLAEAAAVRRVRFIYLSTIKTMCGAYADDLLTEETEPKPQSLYGRLKLAGEQAIMKKAAETGSAAVILRFPIVFGDDIGGNMERLVALAARPVPLPFKGQENARSLISADSLIDAVLRVVEAQTEGQEVYLLQDGSLTIEQLLRLMRQGLGQPARLFALPRPLWMLLERLPLIGPKAQRFTGALELDDRRFRQHFNWQPPRPLEKSLLETVRRCQASSSS